jgi:hypothetical protein
VWILWQYSWTGRKRLGAAVVAALAVVAVVVVVDAVDFRGCLQVVDSGKIAPAVAAVARRRRTWCSWLRERERSGHLRAFWFASDDVSLERRARALTASGQSSLAPRHAPFLECDICD